MDTTPQPREAPSPTPAIKFYDISTSKLVLLFFCTLGSFPLYWNYKNWWAIRDMERSKIVPIGRSIFSIFYEFSLFEKIFKRASDIGYKSKESAQVLAVAYVLLAVANNVVSRMKVESLAIDLWGYFIGFILIIPILKVQKAIYYYNRSIDPTSGTRRSFSKVEKAWLIIGLLLTFFALYGSYDAYVNNYKDIPETQQVNEIVQDTSFETFSATLNKPTGLRSCASETCQSDRYYGAGVEVSVIDEDGFDWYRVEVKNADGSTVSGWVKKDVFEPVPNT